MLNYTIRKLRISRFPAWILLLVSVLFFQCANKNTPAADSFKALKKDFVSPSQHYGSAPLWVWNTRVTKEDIDFMLAGFKDNAFGGVFIHPRPGLITPYLSDEWNDLYTYAVKKGRELGLDIWIYDENSYPSGFAGGHVPDQMPESYNQGEMLHLVKTTMLPDTADNYFICLKKEDSLYTDITPHLDQAKGKPGQYYLFKKDFYYTSDWYGGFSYVDLMVKGVTEKFIAVTMKGYEKSFGNEFGKTVRGIFSDEPNIETQGDGNIRWTPDLFTSFKEKWGYDLTSYLPSLFEETGNWKKIRHNYYQTLLQLFIDRWSKPFSNYTRLKGLEWTGHYWEHAWPNPDNGPDNMAMYAWPQRPGIDMLFNQFNEENPNAQFGNIRSVKELASVANQLNKARTLSETYGGGGWDLSFKDMKRLGDWEFVLGVNTLNQHLSDMTINGARKYDYPQSFSYHNPWWPYYKYLNQHFARLSLALSSGKQQNNILIIEPTTSAWMYFTRDKPNNRFNEIAKQFQSFVTNLEKAQVEYDLGSENIIKDHGKVLDGKFVIGQRAYTTVIIPPGMENIDQTTFSLLREYTNSGGKIIHLEKLQTLDGSANDSLKQFNNGKGNLFFFSHLNEQLIDQHLRSADFKISGITEDSTGGDLYHQRRALKDGQLLFLANASMQSSSKGHIRIAGKQVLLMNTLTGGILNYPSTQKADEMLFDFDLPPAGSQLFFIGSKKKYGSFEPYSSPGRKTVIPGSATKIRRPTENTLMIDFCDVKIGNTLLKDRHVYDATDTVFKHYGFSNGNPWNTSVQFGHKTIDRNNFPAGTGFTAIYHFTIGSDVDFKSFKAVVEQPALWKISVNGHPVQPKPDTWWLDKTFGVLEVGNYLQSGENLLQIIADPMSIYAETEPVYILGDFNLQTTAKGWTIISPSPMQLGSWKTQGLPLYGQTITYTKEIKLDTVPGAVAVRLGKWAGTVAAVKVNGQEAGIIAYDPYMLTISKYLHQGNNRIEIIVTGSLKNLLGPHHNSPAHGLASPWNWREVKNYPAGKDYDTYDYGLLEDFQLIRYDN